MKKSTKKISVTRVRSLKNLAQQIDGEEAAAIKRKGRAIKARHDQLRDLARILKEERQRLGVSLSEVAKRSGIEKGNLSRLENDPHPNPTVDTLLRYAAALGRTIHIGLRPDRSRAA
jgi:DNA-binding XRE family transcriptional regulator